MKRLRKLFFYAALFLASVWPVAAQTNVARVIVNADEVVRRVDAWLFGVNAAAWDSGFDSAATVAALREAGNDTLRFPGGSLSDDYHWTSNASGTNGRTWATSFSKFAHVATNTGAQVFVTVNYGSGTPEEAAAWVRCANVTNHYGFKHWEIGNENYGSWEHDENVPAHDPFTYATRAKEFFSAMRAADPAIKIGVVVEAGEDKYASHTNHPATNPRTEKIHTGWTPVMLATLKQLGVTPDFVIYHRYPQNPGKENDAGLLQSTATWTTDAADLRRQLKDYLGDAATNVELVCTENNSVSEKPGKQSTSLVNALYLADSFGQIAQTEFNALVWWDLRNGRNTGNNNSPSLHGWRDYGDYGIMHGATNFYPTFYAMKLLKYFARGGDKIVRAASDNKLLSAYAARRADGSLALLVINKNPTSELKTDFSFVGFEPARDGKIFSYGVPQDEAARTGAGSPDIAQTNFTGAFKNFPCKFAPYSATVFVFSATGKNKN
jgi:alpha-N-arabinofuranosidase